MVAEKSPVVSRISSTIVTGAPTMAAATDPIPTSA